MEGNQLRRRLRAQLRRRSIRRHRRRRQWPRQRRQRRQGEDTQSVDIRQDLIPVSLLG